VVHVRAQRLLVAEFGFVYSVCDLVPLARAYALPCAGCNAFVCLRRDPNPDLFEIVRIESQAFFTVFALHDLSDHRISAQAKCSRRYGAKLRVRPAEIQEHTQKQGPSSGLVELPDFTPFSWKAKMQKEHERKAYELARA
jgi:hypothetical protein